MSVFEKKFRGKAGILVLEVERMFSKNTTNLFFNPGCALSLYRPENVTELFKYLQSNYPQIQMHNICCRHDPGLPNGSIIVNVCAGCDRRFRTLYDGISTISLWEIIDNLNNFPFPNYHGMEVSVHDPCPVRNTPVVHKAVRGLLQKMNIKVIEAEKIGTNSVYCGDSLYPNCDMEKIHTAMKSRADSMPCEKVVVYCVSCIKAMQIGGKVPCHLTDLLLGKSTDPQECNIQKWHKELDAYIEAH